MIQTRALTEVQVRRLNNFLSASGTEALPSDNPSVNELAMHPGCSEALLGALDVNPQMLIAAGGTLSDLRALGYGSRHLTKDVGLTTAFVRAFGKTEVAASVLAHVEDAVTLAGSNASTLLGLSPRMLLLACHGDRAAAEQVIGRLFVQDAQRAAVMNAVDPAAPDDPLVALRRKLQRGPLHGVGTDVLARLGITALVLRDQFSIALEDLQMTLGCSVEDLQVLGVMSR